MMIGNGKTVNGRADGHQRRSQAHLQKKAGLERARLKVLAT
jgi:hypothetical protein